MIEGLGYITLYLMVGILLLPFLMIVDKYGPQESDAEITSKRLLYIVAFLWPVTIIITIITLWLGGWKYYPDYK